MAETMNINGHDVERIAGVAGQFKCTGCGLEGAATLYATGTAGCPGNPASANIRVCPGGGRCEGHMIQDSAEYRTWKESTNLSADTVPHYYHRHGESGGPLKRRAARAYIEWADAVGVKFSVWALSYNQSVYRPEDEQPGKAAEMTFQGKPWSVWVDEFGKITARPGN